MHGFYLRTERVLHPIFQNILDALRKCQKGPYISEYGKGNLKRSHLSAFSIDNNHDNTDINMIHIYKLL